MYKIYLLAEGFLIGIATIAVAPIFVMSTSVLALSMLLGISLSFSSALWFIVSMIYSLIGLILLAKLGRMNKREFKGRDNDWWL